MSKFDEENGTLEISDEEGYRVLDISQSPDWYIFDLDGDVVDEGGTLESLLQSDGIVWDWPRNIVNENIAVICAYVLGFMLTELRSLVREQTWEEEK